MSLNYFFLNTLLIACLFCNSSTYAQSGLGAHVHGEVKVDIATDKSTLLIMLESPAESFLGFEYEAKTDEQKAKVEKVRKMWTKDLKSYFGSDALLDCKITDSKWNQKFTGKNHSTIYAEGTLVCEKKVSGRKVSFNLKKLHSNIQVIHLQLLRGEGKIEVKKTTKDMFEILL